MPQSKATIAAAFHTKSLQLNGVRVDLQIWDTAGQEKFRSLTPMVGPCACACVLVCVSDSGASIIASARLRWWCMI